jgi:hypothetical protein
VGESFGAKTIQGVIDKFNVLRWRTDVNMVVVIDGKEIPIEQRNCSLSTAYFAPVEDGA